MRRTQIVRLATFGFGGANIRLMRLELQAALPPKWLTASRTDLKGAEVSTSALPCKPPAAAEAPGGASPCGSASPFMGTRAASKDDASLFFLGFRPWGFGAGGREEDDRRQREPKESKEASTPVWMDFCFYLSPWVCDC